MSSRANFCFHVTVDSASSTDTLRIALRRVSSMFDHRGIHFMSFSHFIAVRAIKEATDAAVSCPPQPRRTPTVSQMARRGCGKEKQWPRHSLRLSTHTDMKSPLDMKWMPRRSYKDRTLRIAIRTTTKPSTTPYLQYMEASAEHARKEQTTERKARTPLPKLALHRFSAEALSAPR